MKKLALFAVIIGLICGFGFLGCNNPATTVDAGDATDVIFVWGTMDEETGAFTPGETWFDFSEDSNNYPGNELNLAECNNVYGPRDADGWYKSDYVLGDISDYGEIILYAKLYDKDKNELTTGTSIAQFSILQDGSSGWDDVNKLAERHNIVSDASNAGEGKNGASPKSGATGLPGKLLVQGSYEQSAKTDTSVIKVHVIALEFKLRTDKPIFTVQYGDAVTVTGGNQIHFNNAKFGDGAVVFGFPADWPQTTALAGKKMVFEYTISGITAADPSNATKIQINLQAANKEENKANGEHDTTNSGKGQKYVMLDDPEDGDSKSYELTWTPTGNTTPKNGSGSFKIPFDTLLTAASSGIDTSADGGTFDLTAIRIENNGDTYDSIQKQKTYTLTFTSITIE